MATVSITIPDSVVVELDAAAVVQGFANNQALLVHFIRETVRSARHEAATVAVSETGLDGIA